MSGVTLPKIIMKIEELIEASKDNYEEKHFEACVNRSYYAMFHSVQAFLFIQNFHSKTHVGAHSKFRELYIKTGLLDTTLTDKLQRSFVKRQFSDYDYEEVTEEQAVEAIEDAEAFVKATMTYLKQNNHLK
ncbi:HEPN domain-containing protein [Dyadobacter sp. CY326]|uniref:HEPN domain-containing protein n=1 Tax=Dyadobacter sp. CY326 TaxID=2907300 RepID=UPI001F1F8BB0|nr:HEPN domain-containing protein [Dyadobacter sp. CY326]MCE7066289.1 HEPN domain-containing protein [Dyadobacter sp. CY326]